MTAEPDNIGQVLRRVEDRYRLLAENISEVIFTLDLNLRPTYCSSSVERLSGYTVEEVMSQTLEEVLSHDSCRLAKTILEQNLNREKAEPGACSEPLALELELNKKGGGTVWAEVKVSFLRDERGVAAEILGVSHNVDERKRTEEALLTSQFHLSETMDLAKIVYWELDWTTETFIFNDAFYAFYGTTAEREGGYRMAATEYSKRFVYPGDRAMIQESAQRNRSGKDPEFLVDLEHRIIRRDGEVRYILARTRGFRDAEGHITRCYGANQDITARRQAEEERATLESQLRQAQKMEAIGKLSAGIAHDFRNILTAIGGFANLGIKHAQADSKAKRYLERISRAVERGKDIVGQILTFSYKGRDELGPTQLIPVVRESVRMLRASLRPTIEIREELKAGSSLVLADPTQLQQIIVNLGNNAAYAMEKRGGTLTIGLSDVTLTPQNTPVSGMTAGEYLKLSISDTGVGMDPQTVERAFDPFFTTKTRAEGTGLGLWVVHSIVKKHRGAIMVRSAPGEGSTFDVFLPRIIG